MMRKSMAGVVESIIFKTWELEIKQSVNWENEV